MMICGTSNRQVAKFFRVQTSTISGLWYRHRSTGTADQGRGDLSHYRRDIGAGIFDNTWQFQLLLLQKQGVHLEFTPAHLFGTCGGQVYDAEVLFTVRFCFAITAETTYVGHENTRYGP